MQTLIFFAIITLLVVLGALFPPLFIVYAIIALWAIAQEYEKKRGHRR